MICIGNGVFRYWRYPLLERESCIFCISRVLQYLPYGLSIKLSIIGKFSNMDFPEASTTLGRPELLDILW